MKLFDSIQEKLRHLGEMKLAHPSELKATSDTPEQIAAWLKQLRKAGVSDDVIREGLHEYELLPQADRTGRLQAAPEPVTPAEPAINESHLAALIHSIFQTKDIDMATTPVPQPVQTSPATPSVGSDIAAVITVFKAFHSTGIFSVSQLLGALPQLVELALDIAKLA